MATTGTGTLLKRLLNRTSRTFALSIPVLPEPMRREVSVAYLLFRVADTLEDATLWTRRQQVAALERYRHLIAHPDPRAAASLTADWADDPPVDHAGYKELLADLGHLFAVYQTLPAKAQTIIAGHTRRTVQRMIDYVAHGKQGALRLLTLVELKAYCYAVAGIVGELLTGLFVAAYPQLAPVAGRLERDAATFGEALQLTNMVKDAHADAAEGRFYLPESLERGHIMGMARRDLEVAGRYSQCLLQAGAPRGVVEFTAIPILLAWATLERVERHGPGSKISRFELGRLLKRAGDALSGGTLGKLLPVAAEA